MHHQEVKQKLEKKLDSIVYSAQFSRPFFFGKTIEALQIYRINQFKQMIETLQSKTTKRTP